MYHIFPLKNIRNRAYVVDLKGNKLFFGTVFQCGKFIEYMKEGGDANVIRDPGRMEGRGETERESMVQIER